MNGYNPLTIVAGARAARDPKALARYLNTALNGLIVVSKTRPESEELTDVVEITLKALD